MALPAEEMLLWTGRSGRTPGDRIVQLDAPAREAGDAPASEAARPIDAPARPVGPDDEAELLEAAQHGDYSSIATLYTHFRPRLYGLCMWKLRDPVAAEDAVQETFLRAMLAHNDFDRGRPLWPWLAAIAENYCVDLFRRHRKTSTVEDVADVAALRLPHEEAVRDPTGNAIVIGEWWQRMMEAMNKLPAPQKRALLLFALEGWNHAEIAEHEGLSVSCVKSMVFRARKYLRAVHQGFPNEGESPRISRSLSAAPNGRVTHPERIAEEGMV